MDRREFIKQAACGTAAIVVGWRAPFFSTLARAEESASNVIELGMTTADVEMVDTIQVPHWVYTVNGQPTLPGPFIFAHADETFTIRVTNNINDGGSIDEGRTRRFAIVGRSGSNPFALVIQSADIAYGASVEVTVAAGALAPGTYFYKDPTLDPVSRVLGLHGALIILPATSDPVKNNPYGSFCDPYPNVKALFNDLGKGLPLRGPDALFPGEPWFATSDDNPSYNPVISSASSDSDWYHKTKFMYNPVFEKFYYRTRVWLHSDIDPVLHRGVIDGAFLGYDYNDPEAVRNNHVPHYFSINGRQGAYCSNSHDITLSGTVGQPHLVRMINVGLLTQSPHFHANHTYVVSDNNVIGGFVHFAGANDAGQVFNSDNAALVDTTNLGPESRYDLLFPFIRPPDIPRIAGTDGQLLPLSEMLREELDLVLITPQDPLTYPMHCHTEMAQTAAGGNYPQGQVVHLEFFGEFGKFFKPRRNVRSINIVPRITPLLLNE